MRIQLNLARLRRLRVVLISRVLLILFHLNYNPAPVAVLYNQCVEEGRHPFTAEELWGGGGETQMVLDECKETTLLYVHNMHPSNMQHPNNDEIKFFLWPTIGRKMDNRTIISMGIGDGVTIETAFKKGTFRKCSLKNRDLFSDIDPHTLAFTHQTLKLVEFVGFLRDHVKLKKRAVIDQLLMDVEYAECGMANWRERAIRSANGTTIFTLLNLKKAVFFIPLHSI
ncbi:hypothetical protein QR680_016026 [Steinernema hermaphroditum]|uniref:Methyltransferase FkbM domain-containing protein n=1 Tax=Steinernema hermaphroditum TaxID=289476 RepID=A0AA39LLL9_9BILA|nr:hypothetical protein QR680_016026 [Steinernema hermaphroditum]